MLTMEIPAPTVEADGDDIVTFTCETCAAEREGNKVWVSAFQHDPDNETVAAFAVSVLTLLTADYESHWLTEHAS